MALVALFHLLYILMEALAMLVAYRSQVGWKERKMRMQKVYFNGHITAHCAIGRQ